jgi:tRNA dimethylallyltransferase
LPSTKTVAAIFGPTASGKTAVAETVAAGLGGEVVSADSMQAYRGLPILTAQPERPTRLVGIWSLSHEGSVAEYAELAAALVDLGLPPAPPPELRARWEELYDRLGAERAHAVLGERDPDAAARVHANDRRRVVRALELTELGSSLSPDADRLWTAETRYETIVFGLDLPRDVLLERIERRAREMFDAGVVEEARAALAGDVSSTAIHALGLREVVDLPREEALDALIVRTRRYAAYQRKWMRRIPGLVSVDANRPAEEVANDIVEVARTRQRLPAGRAG